MSRKAANSVLESPEDSVLVIWAATIVGSNEQHTFQTADTRKGQGY